MEAEEVDGGDRRTLESLVADLERRWNDPEALLRRAYWLIRRAREGQGAPA